MSGEDAPGFERLTRCISQITGFTADAYKPRCLRRRIAVRMRAHNVTRYDDYLAILERTPDELQKLADALTINVTKFFRNIELWQRLSEDIVPRLWRARHRPLRVWSAGCASGEESYSLAMVFAETARAAGHPHWVDGLSIDATDIDRVSLERARLGIYPVAVFGETPAEHLSAYTEPTEAGRRRVIAAVRRPVAVHRLDLTRESPLNAPYDLIVCRNVLIYFDRAMQERLFTTFADALRPGGILVLGKVETILGPAKGRLELVDTRERVYRRLT